MSDAPSQFDPNLFLDATTTEAATKRPPLPETNPATSDGLYVGILKLPKFREWQGKKDPTQSGWAIDIPVMIDVPAQLQDSLKLQPQVQLTAGGFVDTTPQGALDWAPGRNRVLRNLRDATGQNVAGQVWNPRMLEGKPVKVKITHDMYESDVVDKIGNVFKP
jgi:hypothetical protein